MKLKYTIFLLLVSSCVIGQIPKKKEIRQFFQAAIESIKNADTTAFIKLWSRPEYLTDGCGNNLDSIASNETIRLDFRKICNSWKPYIYDIDFEIDCYTDDKSNKIFDDVYGYEYIICTKSKSKPKGHTYKYIGLTFKYKNDKLYCTNVLPYDILEETSSH